MANYPQLAGAAMPQVKPPPIPWVLSGPTWRLWAAAAALGVVVFGFNEGTSRVWSRTEKEPKRDLGPDLITGSLVAFLAWRLFSAMHQRRASVSERLRMVAEMNHHVRNALQAISLGANVTHDEQQRIALITENVKRIEWALREVLPCEGAPEAEPKE